MPKETTSTTLPRSLLAAAVGLFLGATGQTAFAADAAVDPFYVHLGPGALLFSPSAKVTAAGVLIPGGTVDIRSNVTGIVEFGYQHGNLGISLTVGSPPLATVRGADTLAPLGPLGRIRYGPAVLSLQYRFAPLGRFRPYVGGGPVFLFIFRNEDLAVQRLKVRDNVGAAVQAGTEYDLDQRWSLFLDAKKAYLRTSARADLGPIPINAKIRLDPTVVSGGVAYRF